MTITYPEAIVVGLLQGVTELFPVSSLGHSVLLPALIGGRWAHDLSVSAPESPYLAFVVGLHVATAIALIIYFRTDWYRIIGGFISSIRHRHIVAVEERLAWMIIVATIPVGLAGLLLEHTFRTVLGRPFPAAAFLFLNGLILFGAERMRRRDDTRHHGPVRVSVDGTAAVYSSSQATDRRGRLIDQAAAAPPGTTTAVDGGETVHAVDIAASDEDDAARAQADDARIADRTFAETTLIGSAQILALLPGISRSGATMAAGLFRGLTHEEAARFSFLLATPVILAAGALKLPDLTGPLGHGILGPVIVGSIASGLGAYAAVRWLTRYFQTRTLTPFAIYCVVAGLGSLLWLTVR
jgi:undecaprenyl-diphosphatase